MFFIVRALFWIGVVVFLLPADTHSKRADPDVVSAPELDVAHTLAVAASFCASRPASCQNGIEAAQQVGKGLGKGAALVASLASDATAVPPAARARIPVPPPRPAERTMIAR
jgi:hypothetical protein